MDSKVLHVTSPGMYMHSLRAVGLELIDFRDLSEHLALFYNAMVDEARAPRLATRCAAAPAAPTSCST